MSPEPLDGSVIVYDTGKNVYEPSDFVVGDIADGGGTSNNLAVVNGGVVALDDTVAEGTLLGYLVKSETTFLATNGALVVVDEVGPHSFVRFSTKWMCYSPTGGVELVIPNPVVTLEESMLIDNPVYLFMLDDAPGTTKPVNIGSGTINTSDELAVGGITFGVASIGGSGTCAEFDGTGYIRTGIPFADAASKADYTIEFLMDATGGGSRTVYDGPSQTNVTLFSNGGVNAYVGTVGGAGAATFGAPVMMAAVCTGGRTKLYRNGVEVGDIGGWAPLGAGPSRSAMIGAYSGFANLAATPEYPDDKYVGKLAAVAIYHTAVSPVRLAAHAADAGIV